MNNYIVFSLSQNVRLAKRISRELDIPLGEFSRTFFKDGEILIKNESNVKDKDVILIESTSKRSQEKLFELMLLLDSLKRSGAKSITLFIPYFGYSRQERSYDGEPVSCEVVAKILETADYEKLFTYDLHHPVIESFFHKPFFNKLTTALFEDYYLQYFQKNEIDVENVVVVAPDHGSNIRVDSLVASLGVSKVILDKVRPEPNVAEHLDLNEKYTVRGKYCIILDDIIDTGGTIVSAANLLYKKGAKAVYVGATHAVFSEGSIDRLVAANIKDIVVTNTIEHDDLPDFVNIIDIFPLVVKEIR